MRKDRFEERSHSPEIREWAERLRRYRTPEPGATDIRNTRNAAREAVASKSARWSPRRRLVVSLSAGLVAALVLVTVGAYLVGRTEKGGELAMTVKADPTLPLAAGTAKTELDARYVASLQSLGAKVLSRLGEESPGENLLVSPTSLSMAFTLCAAGASGETQREMLQALQYGTLGLSDIIGQNRVAFCNLYRDRPDQLQVLIANSVWAFHGTALLPSYQDVATQDFFASLRSVEDRLGIDPIALMNRWVSDHTNGRIQKAVESFSPDTKMVLMNTIYFYGAWKEPFNPKITHKADFTKSDGTVVQVDTMTATTRLHVLETDDSVSIAIPYLFDEAMVVTMPKVAESGSDRLAAAPIGSLDWKDWKEERVLYTFPKFRFSATLELNGIMIGLGMHLAFSGGADFSGMSPTPLFIDKAYQKTYIGVDEKGTEAAAVTIITMDSGSGNEPEREIRFDHPFRFSIVDTQGVPLFLGLVEDPTAE
jgi:serine protease inhibitor